MRRFWIFNHYATTPLTGPLLRHFYFAEYLKEKGIETTVFAANELHQTGGCVDTHGKPYLRTEEEGVPFVFVKTSKYQGNGLSRVKNMISFFTGLMKISRKYAKEYGKPVIAFSGCVTKDAVACNAEGIDAFFPVLRGVVSLDEAMCTANAMANMEDTVEQVFRLIQTFA